MAGWGPLPVVMTDSSQAPAPAVAETCFSLADLRHIAGRQGAEQLWPLNNATLKYIRFRG